MSRFSAGIPNLANDPVLQTLDAVANVTAMSADGALPMTGFCPVTKGTACAMTLATPVAGAPSAGGNDGQVLVVQDTTGAAHTITTASNKIAPSKHIGTFGGTVGQFIELRAYGGLWYVQASSGVTMT